MDMAVRDCNSPGTEPIDYFELTDDELNLYYGSFDKTAGNNNKILYSYKGISIKVNK